MTIIVSASGTTWMADFVGDAEVFDLFGTTILPTPFDTRVPVADVLADLRNLNPGRTVVAA